MFRFGFPKPTRTTVPPGDVANTAVLAPDSEPEHSMVASAPRSVPRDSRMAFAASSGFKPLTLTVLSAPNSRAVCRRVSLMSVTTTFAAPFAFATSKLIRPFQ